MGPQQGTWHCSNSSGKSFNASNNAGRTILHSRLIYYFCLCRNRSKELTAKEVLFRSHILLLHKFIRSMKQKRNQYRINIAQWLARYRYRVQTDRLFRQTESMCWFHWKDSGFTHDETKLERQYTFQLFAIHTRKLRSECIWFLVQSLNKQALHMSTDILDSSLQPARISIFLSDPDHISSLY